ncbi:hypothetical protein StoSoilB3_30620 [Arthrobacter sp. StoSoilB3]|nr:hypothetical protein StoSoilB3_30620 [Arthrobacter sp. StoSoilB3]
MDCRLPGGVGLAIAACTEGGSSDPAAASAVAAAAVPRNPRREIPEDSVERFTKSGLFKDIQGAFRGQSRPGKRRHPR